MVASICCITRAEHAEFQRQQIGHEAIKAILQDQYHVIRKSSIEPESVLFGGCRLLSVPLLFVGRDKGTPLVNIAISAASHRPCFASRILPIDSL
jgi:hypothetical protein